MLRVRLPTSPDKQQERAPTEATTELFYYLLPRWQYILSRDNEAAEPEPP